ncbi:hypothetical protein K469DRAFT_713432 [Zopfia rhizophila CBS 207.26]|uniref:Uncharacterized protein n=1 Tax=Zopfia rhizophila CBS 207.26 TaxID=1314779 RepID=A0A6A6DQN4_9PEZI|nr:hypothetical protein K469DRAFT_713432 [Zopfia rhizophila CBS 207.26]
MVNFDFLMSFIERRVIYSALVILGDIICAQFCTHPVNRGLPSKVLQAGKTDTVHFITSVPPLLPPPAGHSKLHHLQHISSSSMLPVIMTTDSFIELELSIVIGRFGFRLNL